MTELLADRFINALEHLEANRDVEPLARLFADNAECGNVLAPEKFHGADGAREFWQKYRGTFEALQSSFRNKIVHEDRIALEWSTEATAGGGERVTYDGVSILEVSGDRITRFRAYFDSAALGRQMEAH